MKIVFHADDFGATCNVNKNILAAWQAGGLDSVSVLANGDAFDAAASALKRNGDKPLRLMVHLNLSEGSSIAPPEDVPLLVHGNGRLKHGFIGLWKARLKSNQSNREEFLRQVEIEWRLQISKVINTFHPRKISGVDGHIHIHMLPFLFPIAAKLAHQAGLDQIRISNELLHISSKESFNIKFGVNIIKHALLKSLSYPAAGIAKRYNLHSPDRIAGILYSGNMTENVISSAITSARRSNITWLEVLLHPGRALPEEGVRWEDCRDIGKFYLDSKRDMERDTLINFGVKRK